MTDRAALLRSIIEDPADDAPRLVMADWLDEQGDSRWASHIRWAIANPQNHGVCLCAFQPAACDRCEILGESVKVIPWRAEFGETHYVEHRGFVAEVRLPTAAFVGGPCEQCQGEGHLTPGNGPPHWIDCPVCTGTGRTAGIAAELFRAHPVTEVWLVDKRPLQVDDAPEHGRRTFAWFSGPTLSETSPHHLPDSLIYDCRAWYETRADADAALSRACVRFGRQSAGLPATPLATALLPG